DPALRGNDARIGERSNRREKTTNSRVEREGRRGENESCPPSHTSSDSPLQQSRT
ncbi:hypothetical protein J6590_005281, partial [Homalodisca vitripennis]